MKPGVCPLCGSRKARRACPALQQEICAVCCGTKRLTEIRCPPTCGYLHSARTHPAAAVRRRDERELHFFASVLHGTTEKQRAIFAFLQTVIARHAANAVPRLVDRDVVDAAGALAGSFETASRGIIYDQQPTSLPGQRLAADLRQQIEQTLHASERPLDRDLAVALRRTEAMATHAATELDGGATAYLEFLERKIGKGEEKNEPTPDQPPSNLIIPG
jgi:hypothetical protein